MHYEAKKGKKLKDNLQMTWVELISSRSKGDNGDRKAAISLVQTANQKASFDHVIESH